MPPEHAPWLARTRSRVWLACAVACGLVVLAFGMIVTQDRSPLDAFDRVGMRGEDWAHGHGGVENVLLGIEAAFATIGMVIWTSLLTIGLLLRRRVRAALFAVVVMSATSLLTTAVKLLVGRSRPQWQDAVDRLTSKSFPSGHASSSAALAGILLVLIWGTLRGGRLRLGLSLAVLGVWILVCLDRVLLGRHFPTDVVAGSFLGAAVVLVALVAFDPLRHRRPSPRDAEEVAASIATPREADSPR